MTWLISLYLLGVVITVFALGLLPAVENWDDDHCRGSFVRDLRNAAMFEEYAFQLEKHNEAD